MGERKGNLILIKDQVDDILELWFLCTGGVFIVLFVVVYWNC